MKKKNTSSARSQFRPVLHTSTRPVEMGLRATEGNGVGEGGAFLSSGVQLVEGAVGAVAEWLQSFSGVAHMSKKRREKEGRGEWGERELRRERERERRKKIQPQYISIAIGADVHHVSANFYYLSIKTSKQSI